MDVMMAFRRTAAALAILAAAIAATTLGPVAAAAPKSGASAPLSTEQWTKIVKAMDEKGQVRALPPKIAEHLSLARQDQTFNVHELAFEREDYQHGIYRSVDPADQRVILAFRTPEKRWTAFLADSRFRLIAAVVWNAGEEPVAWSKPEALPAFNNELTYWSVIAELL